MSQTMEGHMAVKNRFRNGGSSSETDEDDYINSCDSTGDERYNSVSDRTSYSSSGEESYESDEKESRHPSVLVNNFFVGHSNISIQSNFDQINSFIDDETDRGYVCSINSDEELSIYGEDPKNTEVVVLSCSDDGINHSNRHVPMPRRLINNYVSGLPDNSILSYCGQENIGGTNVENTEIDYGENQQCRNIGERNKQEGECSEMGSRSGEENVRENVCSPVSTSSTNFPKKKYLKIFFNRLTNRVVHNSSNTVQPDHQNMNPPRDNTCEPTVNTAKASDCKQNTRRQNKNKRLRRMRFHQNCISPRSMLQIQNEKSKYTVVKLHVRDDTRDDDEVHIISCVQRVVLFTRRGKSKLMFNKGFDGKFVGNSECVATILDHRKRRMERFPRKHGKKSFCLQGPQARYFLQEFSVQTHKILKKVKVTKKVESTDHLFYKFEGKYKNIALAGLILNKLTLRIKDYTVDLRSEFLDKKDLHLVAEGIRSQNVHVVVQHFQKMHQCVIYIGKKNIDSIVTVSFYFDASKFNHITATERNPSVLIGRWLWSKLKAEIEKQCLFEDCFEFGSMVISPENFRNIAEVAERRSLDLKKQRNNFVIRGEKSAVGELMTFIHRLVIKPVRPILLPKKEITSSYAPARGTVSFLKFAAACPISIPSYWSLRKRPHDQASSTQAVLENVGPKTKSAIEKLINQTWTSEHVGHGRDARGLNHSYIKVTDVKRVENPSLFKAYSARRTLMFERMSSEQSVCTPVGQLSGSSGNVLTTEKLEDFMRKELYHEVNEHYLFHGTHPESIDPVINSGLDPRVSSPTCMWGSGVYAAESSTKSDQYTGKDGRDCNMLLMRVLLGDVYICKDCHPSLTGSQKFTRPPCVHCNKDKCLCPNQKLYDSIMADGRWLFREFVVYDMSQCYPEYLITYERAYR